MASDHTARVLIDTERTIGPISPLIYGGFAEHLGRCVYEGIYDPDSPLADDNGFRTDVLKLLKDWQLSVLRYPGGNFVSNYRWRDGVGPRDQRPRRRDLAWFSVETNQFGTNEFIEYCRALGAEPMMGLNFGTADLRELSDLVEYCNAPVGTEMGDLRAAHGYPQPHKVKYWCLGNEMDGSWQMGAMTAIEYARKALEMAKIMKWHDPEIRTIVCGSSGPGMATWPEWDRVALETCWEHADYLALHNYATNWENDTPSFLGYASEFERQIDVLAATLRYVKEKRRSRHDVFLSQDEWNVWYKDRNGNGRWQEAPHLCEEVYNLEDALVVAQWMSVFLRKCDVLKMAAIAQVANVISPILTRRDAVLKQSTYYLFLLFSRHGRGVSLEPSVSCPRYETKRFGDVPLIDASIAWDEAKNGGAVFLVNRSMSRTVPVHLVWRGPGVPTRISEVHQMTGSDPKLANSWEQPDRVVPETVAVPKIDNGATRLDLPPMSFTVAVCDGWRRG